MTPSTPPAACSEPSVALTEAVQTVFARLEAQLGVRMADMWREASKEAVLDEWASALSGFTKREVNRGLAACQRRAFAPTQSEFTRLCRPALDPEIAWLEAVEGLRQRNAGQMGEWSHPAVWRAACAMAHELSTQPFAKCRKVWEWRLEREFAKGWGKPVPPVARRIAQQAPERAAPSAAALEARAHMARARALLQAQATPPA